MKEKMTQTGYFTRLGSVNRYDLYGNNIGITYIAFKKCCPISMSNNIIHAKSERVT